MTDRLEMNRRQFNIATAAIGGGMVLGIGPVGRAAAQGVNAQPWTSPAGPAGVELSAWIVIAPDDTIVIRVANAEMGNGAITALPMIVCEELECDWSKVKAEIASANRNAIENNVYGSMSTAGSSTVRTRVEPLQKAGANARERLKLAAAQQWNVPVNQIDAKNSVLTHRPTGRTLRFGEVASKAATLKLDAEPRIKSPDQYTMMGQAAVHNLDTALKVNGNAVFAIDVKVPGMIYAAVKASPAEGGKPRRIDRDAIKGRPGVIAVIEIGQEKKHTVAMERRALRPAVAVVAESYWQAKSALDLLPIEWDDGPGAAFSTESIFRDALAALNSPGKEVKKIGDADAAMKTASKTLEAIYQTPYLEHATMEPLSATALITADRADVWAGSQNPDTALTVTAEETGLPKAKVFFQETFLGGGFGRRGIGEEVRQVVAIAKQLPGRPVKMVWSREETTRQGVYRPMTVAKFTAGLGADGMPVAWLTRIASDPATASTNRANFERSGLDSTTIGPMGDPPYAFPALMVDYFAKKTNLRLGNYRGPSSNGTVYKLESFVDECAVAAGKDPVDYRRVLLRAHKDPGWLKSLNDVAAKAEWGKKLPKGTGQGFAIGEGHGTICAVVAQVTVSNGGEVKVDETHISFDSGNIVNKNGIEAQLEGSVAMALTGALYGEINIRNGRVVEGNFDDYQMMRIDEMPKVKVYYGGLTGGTKWGGIGEPALGPVTGAVTNAIFAATGKRVRSLPLRHHDLSWS